MELIIETDIGHDPDDLFAICYLISAGVDIKAITVVPGDLDQIAILRLICDEVGLDIPIGSKNPKSEKMSSGSIHHQLLKKYKRSLQSTADGDGCEIILDVFERHPDAELYIIGPPTNVGRALRDKPDLKIKRSMFQGGFVPYHVHRPKEVLEKFEGKAWVPSFNPNGDRKSTMRYIEADIEDRRFVSKNLCHTILFTSDINKEVEPKDRASELFKEAGDLYFSNHGNKKFHDPFAAVAMLHPEIVTWITGKMIKMESGWSAITEGDDHLAVDLDYDLFWNHIRNFT